MLLLKPSKSSITTEHYKRTLRKRIDALDSLAKSTMTRSPPPRTKFPTDQLRPYIRQLLAKTLANVAWDGADRARMGAVSKELCERIKQKMIELEPKGFKFIVTSTFTENLGQAGRADMSCHWEETDAAIQEMFSNDTMIFVCIAYAVRVV